MKIRSGFVSNSSSSSFIVIEPSGKESILNEMRRRYANTILTVDGDFGRTEYGWENEESNDFESKVIFAYMQALYMIECVKPDGNEVGNQWIDMLERVIREGTGCNDIEWNIVIDYDKEAVGKQRGYIDHQSASHEGENTEMFESESSLYNFLFNDGSYIQTGNDHD